MKHEEEYYVKSGKRRFSEPKNSKEFLCYDNYIIYYNADDDEFSI
jgi:hypothetical protein